MVYSVRTKQSLRYYINYQKCQLMLQSKLYTILFLLFLSSTTFAQNEIYLANPSFEDRAGVGNAPMSWFDCGFPGESPPDVHSADSNFFDVNQKPSDGETYLGMVTRDNDTWESVSQRLSKPLVANRTYQFEIDICKAPVYLSISRKTNNTETYTTPIQLRVWGGSGYCNKLELLAHSSVIKNTKWITYTLTLKPTQKITYLVLEAHYSTPVLFPTNGNILLDNCSPIWPISGDSLSFTDINPYDVEKHDSIRLAYAEKVKNDKLEAEAILAVTSAKRKKTKTIALSRDIVSRNKVTDWEEYPMLSTIDAVEAFFYHTDNYMLKSFFKGKTESEMQELHLTLMEIGTTYTADVLNEAIEAYYLYGQTHRMTSAEKKAFEKLDDTIEDAKAKDDLWGSIDQFIIENLSSFEEENQNFKSKSR